MPLSENQSFFTTISNSVLQMIFGFMIEELMGPVRFALFYFSVGVMANTFAAAVSDWNAAGPEPMIFGMLGGLICLYLYYWDSI